MFQNKKYQAYSLRNLNQIPQFQNLPEAIQSDIQIVGQVYPVRTNNYIVEELIDWENFATDPIFALTFPNKKMLISEHYEELISVLKTDHLQKNFEQVVHQIRLQLNPHPAEQMQNVPYFAGRLLKGIQHKYPETVLFFPNQGQTCHAYCSFCFRWPQFIGINDLKFATSTLSRK